MPHAQAQDGTRIHYQRHEPSTPSTLPPVMLVQGLALSGRFWFDLPQRIANDPTHPRTVLVPDNRGAGASDRPRGPYRMAQLADDLRAVLRTEGVDRAVVVGISMGGMISQHLALRHPDVVDGLVLMATTPGLPHGRLPSLGTLFTLLTAGFTPGPPSRRLMRLLLSERDIDRAAELMAHWPEALQDNPVRFENFISQLSACALHSTGGKLHQVRCPTVVIAGEDDILIPAINSRRIAARIPNCRLELLKDVAHSIPTQDKDAVVRALSTLREMQAGSAPPMARAAGM